MRAVIIDLDNCIANDAWRCGFADAQFAELGLGVTLARWHSYHSMSAFDKPAFQHEFEIELRYLQVTDVLVSTARPQLYRLASAEWLRRHFPFFREPKLFMRENSDARGSVAVKLDSLGKIQTECGIGLEDILCAYDDRLDVLEMYRQVGLRCKRVNAQHKIFDAPPGVFA